MIELFRYDSDAGNSNITNILEYVQDMFRNYYLFITNIVGTNPWRLGSPLPLLLGVAGTSFPKSKLLQTSAEMPRSFILFRNWW